MTAVVIVAIILAIVLGYRTKINIGFFAIVFAYLIGCFAMNMKSGDVISLWPIKIFFIIFAVTLFYNFALANGALEKLADHLLYRCRKFPQLLPLAVFIAATIIAALGAGFYTVLAFMAPITLLLCQKTKMSIIIGGMAVNYGALAGANFMTSQSGIIFRGLMDGIGIDTQTAFGYATVIFIFTILIPIFVLGIYIFWNKNKNIIAIEAIKPAPLDDKQKKSFALILLMIAIVLIFPIMNLVWPDNQTIAFLNARIDISFVAIIFALLSLVLKLADEKKVVALVPWNTLIMICGVGMLISIGVKAGVINLLSDWVSNNVPMWLIPVVLCLIGAIMSVFSSTLGVVTPALFPIVPAIAASSGINPAILFASIVIGAQASAISPFSSGGSLILGSAPENMDKNLLFKQLLVRAVPIGISAAIIATIIAQFIM